MTLESIRFGNVYVVIVAADASDNTKKRFRNSCDYYKVPYVEYKNKEELGKLLGKEFRASICITDKGLAQLVLNNL